MHNEMISPKTECGDPRGENNGYIRTTIYNNITLKYEQKEAVSKYDPLCLK